MKKQINQSANTNAKVIAKIWTDLVGWEKRAITEGSFLLEQLKARNCQSVFDAASGDGFTSVFLLKHGFEVVSNELNPHFRKVAEKNAKMHGARLEVTAFNWKDLHRHFKEGSFDAVLLDGDPLGCELSTKIRKEAVLNFNYILRQGGIFETDEANFPYILRNADEILRGDFRFSGNFIYCGDNVRRIPVKISDEEVVMRYTHLEKKKTCHFKIYPFKEGEIVSLMEDAGFGKIETFSDFKPGYDPNADFFMYVGVK